MTQFVYIVYPIVGALLGVVYAMLTGATWSEFFLSSYAMFACMAAPAILAMLWVFRKLWRDECIPFARMAYRTMLGAVGAPIVVTFASYDAALFGWKALGYALFSIRYATCPAILVGGVALAAVAMRRNVQRRTAIGPPSTGGTPPSDSSDPGTRPATAHRTEASGPPEQGSSTRLVACFSSRGTPFRLVPRSGS